jgi:hypothetical protein
MNRQEAERALTIIRGVIESTHEDLVEHNWGVLWMIHAFTNSITLVIIGHLLEASGSALGWYLIPLGVNGVVNLTTVLLLAKREQGIRSFVQWQIHGIWITFMVLSVVAMFVLYLADIPARLFCSLFAILTSYAFSMMGVVFHRRFFASAVVFAGLAILAPRMGHHQWDVIAVGIWLTLFIPGLQMHRERRARANDESRSTVL